MTTSTIHNDGLVTSTHRLADASRLLEILLFTAERFREGSRRLCQTQLATTNGKDGRERDIAPIIPHEGTRLEGEYQNGNDGKPESEESELLYRKAYKTALESQRWTLSEVFPSNDSMELTRRLEVDPPLVLMVRPGLKQIKRGRKRQDDDQRNQVRRIRNGVTLSNLNDHAEREDSSSLPFKHLSQQRFSSQSSPSRSTLQQYPPTTGHPSINHDIPSSRTRPYNSFYPLIPHTTDNNNIVNSNNNKLKDLHINVKLSNLSALIETLEDTPTSQWLANHTPLHEISNAYPSASSPKSSSSFGHSQFQAPHSSQITQSTSHNDHDFSSRRFSHSSSSSSNFSDHDSPSSPINSGHNTTHTHPQPTYQSQPMYQSPPTSPLPNVYHWESLLAACLLCIQLWKLLQSLESTLPHSSMENHPFLPTTNHRPLSFDLHPIDTTSSSIDENNSHEWIDQLDKLTWRLELLAQSIIEGIQLTSFPSIQQPDSVTTRSPFVISSMQTSKRSSIDEYTLLIDVNDDSTPNHGTHDTSYRSNRDDRQSPTTVSNSASHVPSSQSTARASVTAMSTSLAAPILNSSNPQYGHRDRCQYQPNKVATVYMLKSCRPSQPQPVPPTVSNVQFKNDVSNDVVTDIVEPYQHSGRLKAKKIEEQQSADQRFAHTMTGGRVTNPQLSDPSMLPSLSSPDHQHRHYRNHGVSKDQQPSFYANDDPQPYAVNVESQMYLSRVTMPRLVPIWDDTLEAEVNQSRFEELTRVQQALHDLYELQETVALKTIEEGEQIERTEQALGHTETETRDANVELAKANKARSSWWGLKASGVSTVGGAVAGGLILGPVGAVAGGSLAGAAGLIAGNSLRKTHDAKMDRIVRDNKQPRPSSTHYRTQHDSRPRTSPSSLSTHTSSQYYNPSSAMMDSTVRDRSVRVQYPSRMPFL